jgi:hypothetical protein
MEPEYIQLILTKDTATFKGKDGLPPDKTFTIGAWKSDAYEGSAIGEYEVRGTALRMYFVAVRAPPGVSGLVSRVSITNVDDSKPRGLGVEVDYLPITLALSVALRKVLAKRNKVESKRQRDIRKAQGASADVGEEPWQGDIDVTGPPYEGSSRLKKQTRRAKRNTRNNKGRKLRKLSTRRR